MLSRALLLSLGTALWSCGTAQGPTPSGALTIIEQPANASTPLGQAATFIVIAIGPGTLRYQWNKNGTVIPGATGSSYTTPAVVASDTGSTYMVAVSDSDASIESSPATLTVGPRSPTTGDLRFQQVDASSNTNVYSGTDLILWYPTSVYYPNGIGSPLRLGLGNCVPGIMQDCGWLYSVYLPPAGSGESIKYWPDVISALDSDLASVSTAYTVVTSLDLETANDVYGMSLLTGIAGGFDYGHETASLTNLQNAIANDGAKGRVVTAISFNDASVGIDFLSYGWTSNNGTVYETSVATASFDNIGPAATSLANAGYIITAFGGNGPDGYILVGTRVQGDSIPRPLLVSPPTNISILGYALVGWATNTPYGSNPSPPVWLFEE